MSFKKEVLSHRLVVQIEDMNSRSRDGKRGVHLHAGEWVYLRGLLWQAVEYLREKNEEDK